MNSIHDYLPPHASQQTASPGKSFLILSIIYFSVGAVIGYAFLIFPDLFRFLLLGAKEISEIGASAVIGSRIQRIFFIILSGSLGVIFFLIPAAITYLLLSRSRSYINAIVPSDLIYRLEKFQSVSERLNEATSYLSDLRKQIDSIVDGAKKVAFEVNELAFYMSEYRKKFISSSSNDGGDVRRVEKVEPSGG